MAVYCREWLSRRGMCVSVHGIAGYILFEIMKEKWGLF